MSRVLLGNASLFTKFLFTIFVPLNPPPPNQQNDGFPLEFLLKGPQTELRTLSQNCEQTLQKLRTNRIMNKRAFLNCFGEENSLSLTEFWGKLGELCKKHGERTRFLSIFLSGPGSERKPTDFGVWGGG